MKAVAVDDQTLEITLDAPCSYFLKMMSMPVFYPSKEGAATNENDAWWQDPATSLGNGAFTLESYTDGVGYTVVKNPYYYQADKVRVPAGKTTLREFTFSYRTGATRRFGPNIYSSSTFHISSCSG